MKEVLAEVITIGDEILYGEIIDTNTQWISEKLAEIGAGIVQKTSVPDNEVAIKKALKEAELRAQIIITTGGLGPTKDDITKKALTSYFNATLVLNEKALQNIESLFKQRGKEINKMNYQQALLPNSCIMLNNYYGTASGMWFEKNDKVIIALPGVPHEMKGIMEGEVIPRLKSTFTFSAIYHKVIKTVGIGESWIAEKIKKWEEQLPKNIKLAYLPSLGQVKLRLTGKGDSLKSLKNEIENEVAKLTPIINKYIYGFGHEELEQVIGKILLEQAKTIALAESCTGGYVTHKITSVPGSSNYFQGSIVPYQNDMKIKLLGVKPETIEKFGAVSEETVFEMANNVKNVYHADLGLASSGIAGPSGGTPEKPVGTVWIACATKTKTITKKLSLTSYRDINIKWTSVALLDLARKTLLGKH